MSLDNFRKVNITLNKANQRVLETQIAKVGDVNGRELVVQVTNNGVIEDQTGTTLKLNWQHENGNQGSTNFKVIDIKTGRFSVYYPKEMLYKGKVNASIEITSNGQITNSMNFKIIVQADVFNGEAGTVNGVFISLANVNKKLDDREKEYVELKERQTSVETQFDSIQQEITDKDVVSAPEIIAARNGEDNLKTRIDKDHQEVTTQLAQKVTIQDKTITVNIPSDYSTLQNAIDDLSTKKNKQGVIFILKIETGHKLTNGVKVQDGDYGHFRIESVDPIVYLDASFPPSDSIVEGNRAVMPTLACVVDGQGLYGQNGYYARNYSRGYVEEHCGVRNIKGNNSYSPDMYGIGLMCEASEVYAYKSVFSGNRINLWATRTSRVFADTSDFKNATGEHGVFCSRSSLLSISGSIVTGCAVNALTAYRSIVTAVGSTDLSNAGSKSINAASGSTVIINQRHTATPNISNSDYGIYAHSSKIIADNAIIDGNRYGIYAEKNSHVNVDGSSIQNSNEVGVRAEESSFIYAVGAVVKNSTIYNIQCRFLSQVNIKDATATGAGTKDIFIDGSGTVFARGCTTTNSSTTGRPNVLDTNTFASDGGFDTFHKNKGVIWTANPHNKGVGKNVPVTSGLTNIEIAFSVEEDTNSYAIHVTPNWNTVCWVTNKTVNGFTINFGTPPTTNRTLDWIMRK